MPYPWNMNRPMRPADLIRIVKRRERYRSAALAASRRATWERFFAVMASVEKKAKKSKKGRRDRKD